MQYGVESTGDKKGPVSANGSFFNSVVVTVVVTQYKSYTIY